MKYCLYSPLVLSSGPWPLKKLCTLTVAGSCRCLLFLKKELPCKAFRDPSSRRRFSRRFCRLQGYGTHMGRSRRLPDPLHILAQGILTQLDPNPLLCSTVAHVPAGQLADLLEICPTRSIRLRCGKHDLALPDACQLLLCPVHVGSALAHHSAITQITHIMLQIHSPAITQINHRMPSHRSLTACYKCIALSSHRSLTGLQVITVTNEDNHKAYRAQRFSASLRISCWSDAFDRDAAKGLFRQIASKKSSRFGGINSSWVPRWMSSSSFASEKNALHLLHIAINQRVQSPQYPSMSSNTYKYTGMYLERICLHSSSMHVAKTLLPKKQKTTPLR